MLDNAYVDPRAVDSAERRWKREQKGNVSEGSDRCLVHKQDPARHRFIQSVPKMSGRADKHQRILAELLTRPGNGGYSNLDRVTPGTYVTARCLCRLQG